MVVSSAHRHHEYSLNRSKASLLRSLSAIHQSPVVDDNAAGEDSGHGKPLSTSIVHQGSSRPPPPPPPPSILRRNSRRGNSFVTTTAPLPPPPPFRHKRSPSSTAVNMEPPRRIIQEDLLIPPFGKGDGTRPCGPPTSQSLLTFALSTKNDKKFQRQYSPFTADMARLMVNNLLATEKIDDDDDDKQQLQRQHVAQPQPRSSHAMIKTRTTNSSSSPPRKTKTTTTTTTADESTKRYRGYRDDYLLGDTARFPSHMILNSESSHEKSMAAIDSLKKHDFAFVKRSDGSYSYAILAHRASDVDGTIGGDEECMIFVMSNSGSTKVILKKHWCQFVCLVRMPSSSPSSSSSSSTEVMEQQQQEQQCVSPEEQNVVPTLSPNRSNNNIAPPVVLCQEIERAGGDDTDEMTTGLSIPSLISFVPEEIGDDECSFISSVSDKARCHARLQVC